jgi:hypothetical protein
MAGQQTALSFCWWNLHDFAHFDANRASGERWPKRAEDFEAKRDRILATLQELFAGGFLVALEVNNATNSRAAATLRTEVFPRTGDSRCVVEGLAR